jgi:hypothetical protein
MDWLTCRPAIIYRHGAACRCSGARVAAPPRNGWRLALRSPALPTTAQLRTPSPPIRPGLWRSCRLATGWTECAPLLVREQGLLTAVLGELRTLMPFALLGFDSNNDSVFMNETVQTYCQEAAVAFTRCRSYRKNDQAWGEQKNGAVVRRMMGYQCLEGLEAAAALRPLPSRRQRSRRSSTARARSFSRRRPTRRSGRRRICCGERVRSSSCRTSSKRRSCLAARAARA